MSNAGPGVRAASDLRSARVPLGASLPASTSRPSGRAQVDLRARTLEQSPSCADLAALAERLVAAPADSSVTTLEPGPLAKLWRDFGVNPVAMIDRAFVHTKPKGGEPLQAGLRAEPRVIEPFGEALSAAVDDASRGGLDATKLAALEVKLGALAAEHGVELRFSKGAPTVAWAEVPKIDVMHSGGDAALHELVHVAQFAIGAVAALSSAASAKLFAAMGTVPTVDEVRAAMRTLSPVEKARAFEAIVAPMDRAGNALLEEGAFHATGFMSKRARDPERYAARFAENVAAYVEAYRGATLPKLDSALDAKVYGGIGHLARTHGETTALFMGGLLGYGKLLSMAMALHPAAAALGLVPAAYLLYRAWRG